jgi:hypothetical protein
MKNLYKKKENLKKLGKNNEIFSNLNLKNFLKENFSDSKILQNLF